MSRHWILFLLIGYSSVQAAECRRDVDASTGWAVYTLSHGNTVATVVPAAGANVQSVVHSGAEYFHQPNGLKNLPGVRCGNPILYPTPNRIHGAQFTFEGRTYEFPPNGRGNFIHGLVHSEPFEVESVSVEKDSVTIVCRLVFKPDGRPFTLFPWEHTFRMAITVRDGSVRWAYEVDNDQSDRNLPFGVALHPYIRYQRDREQAYLSVPATHLMESRQQLPTGKLLDLEGQALDARKPVSLAGFHADDVFFGMRPSQPARISFRDVGRSITFRASKEFTHLVVWTPDRPYLGIENQTCSTDAHNLASRGLTKEAHLQICPPGEKRSGFVEYQFE